MSEKIQAFKELVYWFIYILSIMLVNFIEKEAYMQLLAF